MRPSSESQTPFGNATRDGRSALGESNNIELIRVAAVRSAAHGRWEMRIAQSHNEML